MSTAINIVGAGKVAASLARLWHRHGIFSIGHVVNSSLPGAERAVEFIGAGTPCRTIAEMSSSPFLMIGVIDSDIRRITADLRRHDVVAPKTIVFHLSGALSARELAPLLDERPVFGASLHPMRSFDAAIADGKTLRNTWCTLEGDDEACERLSSLFADLFVGISRIPSDSKLTYHAASVFACNYLVCLVEVATRLLGDCGVPRAEAMQMLGPLVDGTVANLKRLPTAAALTGPIARADVELVARQLDALKEKSPVLSSLYTQLGRIAVDLARERAQHTPAQYDNLLRLFEQQS